MAGADDPKSGKARFGPLQTFAVWIEPQRYKSAITLLALAALISFLDELGPLIGPFH